MTCLTRVATCALLASALPGQEPKTAEKPQYFDEPGFIAAGVTDSANRGGHGSDPVLRSTEALARATASLGSKPPATVTEESLRAGIAREPDNAAFHRSLAEVEEKRGNALEALREYQRAVELEPSEIALFDLGNELLVHRAIDQAAEVFSRSAKLFPRSSRMQLGLAVARYAQGSYDLAKQAFFTATDLDPNDPTPYLFLGKVQSGEIIQSGGFAMRIERFAKLHPENAWANYYYAIDLRRQSDDVQAQAVLEKALRLDSQLGAAWLELGILHAGRKEDGKAISAWQHAIAADPQIIEAHYRLSQAYRRIGEPAKAKAEIDLYQQMSKQSADKLERERAEIKQFVFDLKAPAR